MTEAERLAIGSLTLQYAQLSASVMDPKKLPKLQEFIPTVHEPAPEPVTFHDWARVLLPLAGG